MQAGRLVALGAGRAKVAQLAGEVLPHARREAALGAVRGVVGRRWDIRDVAELRLVRVVVVVLVARRRSAGPGRVRVGGAGGVRLDAGRVHVEVGVRVVGGIVRRRTGRIGGVVRVFVFVVGRLRGQVRRGRPVFADDGAVRPVARALDAGDAELRRCWALCRRRVSGPRAAGRSALVTVVPPIAATAAVGVGAAERTL